MADIDLLGAYAAVVLLGAMSPGPDFALVTRFAVLHGRRIGLGASAGVALGMAVNTTTAVVGVGAAVAAVPWLFRTVSYAGACYLIYLGVRGLLAIRSTDDLAPSTAGPSHGEDVERSVNTAFRQGLLTNLLNPKSVVFLVALLPQFLSEGSTWDDKALLGSVTVLVVLLWFSVVAVAMGALQSFFRRAGARRGLNVATGTVLILLGGSLFLT